MQHSLRRVPDCQKLDNNIQWENDLLEVTGKHAVTKFSFPRVVIYLGDYIATLPLGIWDTKEIYGGQVALRLMLQ